VAWGSGSIPRTPVEAVQRHKPGAPVADQPDHLFGQTRHPRVEKLAQAQDLQTSAEQVGIEEAIGAQVRDELIRRLGEHGHDQGAPPGPRGGHGELGGDRCFAAPRRTAY